MTNSVRMHVRSFHNLVSVAHSQQGAHNYLRLFFGSQGQQRRASIVGQSVSVAARGILSNNPLRISLERRKIFADDLREKELRELDLLHNERERCTDYRRCRARCWHHFVQRGLFVRF